MGWNYLSILKLQRCNPLNLGIDKYLLYWACDYLSKLGFKLIHASKRVPWRRSLSFWRYFMSLIVRACVEMCYAGSCWRYFNNGLDSGADLVPSDNKSLLDSIPTKITASLGHQLTALLANVCEIPKRCAHCTILSRHNILLPYPKEKWRSISNIYKYNFMTDSGSIDTKNT